MVLFTLDDDRHSLSIVEAFKRVTPKAAPPTTPNPRPKTPPKKKGISAADFFGVTPVNRTERKTPVSGKRKVVSRPEYSFYWTLQFEQNNRVLINSSYHVRGRHCNVAQQSHQNACCHKLRFTTDKLCFTTAENILL